MPVAPVDVHFKSEDGVPLHGWYFAAPVENRKNCTILFFHGNAENLTSHFYALYSAPANGYNYFIFDYRGYGQSGGDSPNPKGTVADGRAAIQWLRKHEPDRSIVIFGQSLGGAIALRAVLDLRKDFSPKAVIVDSTFPSYQSVARWALSQSWLTWFLQPLTYVLLSDRYAPDGQVAQLSPVPLLVIHGTQDHVVGHEMSDRLFSMASEPKEFWKIEGGQHIDFMWRDNGKYATKFYEYLDKYCIASVPQPGAITENTPASL